MADVIAPSLAPAPRVDAARRLLAAQHALASVLGQHFVPNIPLEVLIALYLAEDEGVVLGAADIVQQIGPSANVTWRWILSLRADDVVAVDPRDPASALELTHTGRDRICRVLDVLDRE